MVAVPGQPSQAWWDRAVRILSMVASPARPCAIAAAGREHGFDPVWLQEVKEWMDLNLPDCVDAGAGEHTHDAGPEPHTVQYPSVKQGAVNANWQTLRPYEHGLDGAEHIVAYNGTLKRVTVANANAVAVQFRIRLNGFEIATDITGPSGKGLFIVAEAVAAGDLLEIEARAPSGNANDVLVVAFVETI